MVVLRAEGYGGVCFEAEVFASWVSTLGSQTRQTRLSSHVLSLRPFPEARHDAMRCGHGLLPRFRCEASSSFLPCGRWGTPVRPKEAAHGVMGRIGLGRCPLTLRAARAPPGIRSLERVKISPPHARSMLFPGRTATLVGRLLQRKVLEAQRVVLAFGAGYGAPCCILPTPGGDRMQCIAECLGGSRMGAL